MTVLASVVALVLAAIAALHAYWGFGGVWPGTDEKSCARAVAGFRGIEKMPPPPAALAVTLALLAAAAIALVLGGVIALDLPAWLLALAGVAAAAVFIGRGLAGFTPAWRRLTPELPFARNDVRYFSPLCLMLGAGLLVLSFQGSLA